VNSSPKSSAKVIAKTEKSNQNKLKIVRIY
jgi:hypothetical protein